jgi:Zn-dependent M28 family amino/carboxypeptidase
VALVAFVALVVAAGAVYMAANDGERDDDSELLRRAVTIDGIREHLNALQRIADDNNGTRYAGSKGFDDSVDYVNRRLEEAGYDVELQAFDIPVFEETSPPSLVQLKPSRVRFEENKDFVTMLYSDNGSVRARAVSVGLKLGVGRTQVRSGCDATAYSDFPEGAIALVQRSNCFYRDQAESAEAAGAAGMIVIQDVAGRGILRGTLLPDSAIGIPVVAVSPSVGRLLALGKVKLRIRVDAVIEPRQTNNVLAEIGSDDGVLIVGGHLDSVRGGPGINDNGSGVATLLEIAEQYASLDNPGHVRFAFWSGEEFGLLGSAHYVTTLDSEALEEIDAYLNFDMVGSPNYVRFVYDGSGSPESSDIQKLFESYFEARGLESELIPLEGRSDHALFETAGVPVGGLFSGAENVKTRRQAEIYGGQAGEPTDPCYHLFCDDIENVNFEAVDEFADAAAHAIAVLS